jgi:hypothetical protein
MEHTCLTEGCNDKTWENAYYCLWHWAAWLETEAERVADIWRESVWSPKAG